MSAKSILSASLLLSSLAVAAVRHLPDRQLFILDTKNTSYVVGVNKAQQLQMVHWGGRIAREADLTAAQMSNGFAFETPDGLSPEEYPAFGGMRYSEPCLKATLPGGVRDVVLKYVSHVVDGEKLSVRLKDINADLFVTLHYQVFPNEDIISRSATIENRLSQPVALESAQSAAWNLPPGEGYRLTYLAGRWATETQLTRQDMTQGKIVLESRRINTSHQQNPWFAVDGARRASETDGDVWFGALGWSGNWKIVAEQTPYQQARITGGYNDFDFLYTLQGGESLQTPSFYAGYTQHGFGEASRVLHRFALRQILPESTRSKPRPVLYNSWEATEFHVDEAGQAALAVKAKQIGAELFVMDDGWFGARNHDRAGLGDWTVNKTKFPNGLKGLIDKVHAQGMPFGLWVEPEMINPDSDLFRAHPDWAIQFPGRPRTEGRNQLILNMARDEVKEYIFGVLDKLLAENDIAFFKWDMNRHVTEPGWAGAPGGEQRRIWIKYVNNVHEIFDRLRAKYPKLEIESCSGGGGRIDLGIMKRVEQVWTSDNTEAYDRLKIQEGYSFAYPMKAMMAWVTDVPNMNGRVTPLKYRFLVAMQGSLGIGGDLNKWSDNDMKLAALMVETYKRIRGTVQMGSLYRLDSPREGSLTANSYVAEDGRQAVLFAFLDHQQFRKEVPAIRLRGLDANSVYRITATDDKLLDKITSASGSFLMNHGLRLRLGGDYDSSLVILEKE
jgi:alpha-galactosidase